MTEDKTDIEIKILEDLFAEESHCEMEHKKIACASEVTHVAIDCRRPYLVCITAYRTISKMLEFDGKCVHCQQPAKDCWRITPV